MLVKNLDRVFVFEDNNQTIRLDDPNPKWSPQAVMNFYANTYPILTTAKVSSPKIKEDKMEYRFESTMGTKG